MGHLTVARDLQRGTPTASTAALPAWNLGGDPSRAPLLIPGVYQSQGSLDGVMRGAWNFTLPVNLHGELAQVLNRRRVQD